MVIEEVLDKIARIGCDRVVTTHDGGAVPYENAINEYGIDVEIIFIRNDGWTLGCNRNMFGAAYHLWYYQWKYILIKPRSTPMKFEDFANLGPEGQQDLFPKEYNYNRKINQPKSFSKISWLQRR